MKTKALSTLLREIKENEAQNAPRFVRKIHLFYEGAVTEKELLLEFIKVFNKYEMLFSYFKFSMMGEATTSYTKIKNIIKNEYYFNEEGQKVYIFRNDYVLFLYDFDIFYDYKEGANEANTARVKRDIYNFDTFVKELNRGYYARYNFLFTPSFPSIEYALSLGIEENISDIKNVHDHTRNGAITALSKKTGRRISQNEKHFTPYLYRHKAFNLNVMWNNARLDRENKKLPLTALDLQTFLYLKGVNSIITANVPYTYIDNIIFVAEKIVTSALPS